ncbi:hypothetical protein K1719_044020 [Acacia pycnantha]|nr:hypothetical protein K1719_044020 [Acacia pycnantha]
MADKEVEVGTSYRNKLLNLNCQGPTNQSQKEVVLTENDFQISKEGDIPSIVFSEVVREVLSKGIERTLIIKLLGRSITYHDLRARTQALWQLKGSFQLIDMEGSFYFATFDREEDYTKALTGGPWMIFGAYLTVQPWSLDFDAKSSSAISKVVAWVRIPGLSFRYYHKSTLRAIGMLMGDIVKIDFMTETRGRGKFARIAVLIDILKPLVPWIMFDGKRYGVEYEGLPLICFECGMYGHPKGRCKTGDALNIATNQMGKGTPTPVKSSDTTAKQSTEATVDCSSEALSSPFVS